uniref:WGS project CAEQ00000000 data, annotated contig 1288 n=1 Tax=Trypanosoma congolense (strain IL3000) TaxID=1068625 RepID=F9W583_TRYCI|nr:unnamed protein product [Trypanosoma congolense IL3000]
MCVVSDNAFRFFLLCLCTALCGVFPSPVTRVIGSQPDAGEEAILLEQMMAQSFSVSVMSGRYGVFNASLILSGSTNFPAIVHGELIPVGTQRIESDGQQTLEHFLHPRSLLGEPVPGISDEAHPSLLSINIKMDFYGASEGMFSAWSLPSHGRALQDRLAALEEKDVKPTVLAGFSFYPEAPNASRFSLNDILSAARMASGDIVMEDGEKGTYTFSFLSDHEFTLMVRLAGDSASAADNLWVHGYTAPNMELFPRPGQEKLPVWWIWALQGVWVVLLLLQFRSLYVNSQAPGGRQNQKKGQTLDAIKEKKNK